MVSVSLNQIDRLELFAMVPHRTPRIEVSGQFRQWAMGRSSLQQQLSQHSAWLRDLKREVSSR